MTGWRRWFAWYPVELQSGQLVWCRYVEYETGHVGGFNGAFGSGPIPITHYRFPDDAI